MRSTPAEVEAMGQVVRSWLIRTWAPSRAREASEDSRLSRSRFKGLGSEARRRPRSNV